MNNTAQDKIIIQTRDFGEQEISKADIIDFPNGIFGFEDSKRFVVLSPLGDEASPMWLQSVDSIVPCFIVFKPLDFITDYAPEPALDDLALIKLEDKEDIEVLSIAVIPEDYKKTTLNIKSPIIVNKKDRIAVQTILDEDYDIKFPLYQSIKEE